MEFDQQSVSLYAVFLLVMLPIVSVFLCAVMSLFGFVDKEKSIWQRFTDTFFFCFLGAVTAQAYKLFV